MNHNHRESFSHWITLWKIILPMKKKTDISDKVHHAESFVSFKIIVESIWEKKRCFLSVARMKSKWMSNDLSSASSGLIKENKKKQCYWRNLLTSSYQIFLKVIEKKKITCFNASTFVEKFKDGNNLHSWTIKIVIINFSLEL